MKKIKLFSALTAAAIAVVLSGCVSVNINGGAPPIKGTGEIVARAYDVEKYS